MYAILAKTMLFLMTIRVLILVFICRRLVFLSFLLWHILAIVGLKIVSKHHDESEDLEQVADNIDHDLAVVESR